MTYVVSVLVVPLSAYGERKRAMAVDVGAGRMDWLAVVDLEVRQAASIEEQARRQRAMPARVEE